ncbi:MAG: type II CAAX endopeptidase family protein [Lachnospiraceae bacterium]|nr:type II CAAX endopeptidase family protein [Lachnospiraceae bacterium]
MNYDTLRHRIPEGIPRNNRRKKPLGMKNALLFFLVVMLLFAVIGSLIQYALGFLGVAITELFFLIASIVYVKRKGIPLREVFPVKKPKLTAVAGTVILWIGSYMLMIVMNLLMMAWVPEFPANGDADAILGSGLNWFFLFLVIVLLPPVCEEAMHRGVIQYGLGKRIRNPWLMAVVIGLIFGLFHLDPSKFLATGLLGGVMGWIMFKTNNMFYSSLFHLIHNGSQLILMALIPAIAVTPEKASLSGAVFGAAAPVFSTVKAGSQAAVVMTLISAGVTTISFGIVIPLVLYVGNYLLNRDIAPRRQRLIPTDKNSQKASWKGTSDLHCLFCGRGASDHHFWFFAGNLICNHEKKGLILSMRQSQLSFFVAKAESFRIKLRKKCQSFRQTLVFLYFF